MTDRSVSGTRPRYFPTDEEKLQVARLSRRIADDLDNPSGTLMITSELPRIFQAIREGRVQVIPPKMPDLVHYIQDDWSDLKLVPVKALNLSKTLTNLLRNDGIETVWQLLTMPEAEIFGDDRPRNLGTKSIESIQRALRNQDLELISDPAKILFEDAGRRTMDPRRIVKLGVYDIWDDDIIAMSAKFGIVTLRDLSSLKISIDEICNELLSGDHDYSCIAYARDGGWRSPNSFDEGIPPLEERIAKSIVIVFNAILARYGLPALQM